MSAEFKVALENLLSKVAYIDANGQTYLDALHTAMYPPANLTRISAVYTQSGTVYNTDLLDSLKSDLVVTAHMSDGTSQTVTTYALSGTLAEGTSTITVTYGGKTTTFNVVVSAIPYLFKWDYSQGLPTNYGCELINSDKFSMSMESNGLLLTCTASNSNGGINVPSEYRAKPTVYSVEYDIVPSNFNNGSWGGIALYHPDTINNKTGFTHLKADGLYNNALTASYNFVTGTEYTIKTENNKVYVNDVELGNMNVQNQAPSQTNTGVAVALNGTALYLKAIRINAL